MHLLPASSCLIAGVVAMTAVACADSEPAPVPNATLAGLTNLRLELAIGLADHGGPGRLYMTAVFLATGCATLDETFGFRVDGVEVPHPYAGGPDDWECGRPGAAIDLDDGPWPTEIRMYDASLEVVALLDARQVERRTLMLTSHASWAIAAGQQVTVTASHPEDFAAPVTSAEITARSPIESYALALSRDGNQLTFPMPAGLEDADGGEVRIGFGPTDLGAESCQGAAGCTFHWSPATYVLPFER